MNNITIKFGTEYKPTKHNVVNKNFTQRANNRTVQGVERLLGAIREVGAFKGVWCRTQESYMPLSDPKKGGTNCVSGRELLGRATLREEVEVYPGVYML